MLYHEDIRYHYAPDSSDYFSASVANNAGDAVESTELKYTSNIYKDAEVELVVMLTTGKSTDDFSLVLDGCSLKNEEPTKADDGVTLTYTVTGFTKATVITIASKESPAEPTDSTKPVEKDNVAKVGDSDNSGILTVKSDIDSSAPKTTAATAAILAAMTTPQLPQQQLILMLQPIRLQAIQTQQALLRPETAHLLLGYSFFF